MPDYTKLPLSKSIKACPKCGRNGKLEHIRMDTYRRIDGVKVPHIADFDSYAHVRVGNTIREHCTVNYACVPLDQGVA